MKTIITKNSTLLIMIWVIIIAIGASIGLSACNNPKVESPVNAVDENVDTDIDNKADENNNANDSPSNPPSNPPETPVVTPPENPSGNVNSGGELYNPPIPTGGMPPIGSVFDVAPPEPPEPYVYWWGLIAWTKDANGKWSITEGSPYNGGCDIPQWLQYVKNSLPEPDPAIKENRITKEVWVYMGD